MDREEWLKGVELDPAFAERDRCRKAGKPVEIVRTKRLLVRETVPADVPALYEMGKEPGVRESMRSLQPTLEEELEFMAAYIRHAYAFYDFGLWTVLEPESGEVVGRAGLFPSEILEEGVELGYLIRKDRRGRGYASECCRAILAYASETLDIHTVHVLVDRRNQASVRTARRLGFTERECIRDGRAEWTHWIRESS